MRLELQAVERRLRKAIAEQRDAIDPAAGLEGRIMRTLDHRLGGRPMHKTGLFSMMPSVAMTALVLVAGIGLAYGAIQLRNLGRASASPPVRLASPSATQLHAKPGVVPALAAIQMVGPELGWAVGADGIYATTDGSRWVKQYSSADEFIAVDFIDPTTGWAVGIDSLVGTTDGGRTWHHLGNPRQPFRSVHFISRTHGWGIAGGDQPPGSKIAGNGAILVKSSDGGLTWTAAISPPNPESLCVIPVQNGVDTNVDNWTQHVWLATATGTVFRSLDSGGSWTAVLQMANSGSGQQGNARIECSENVAQSLPPRTTSGAWVEWAPGGAAAGHSPYVVYTTLDNGVHWRTVMAEPGTIAKQLPGVPAGPGSYPGSFSVVDADAIFLGDTPAADSQSIIIASNGGATLKSTGSLPRSVGTFDAQFVSTTTGWVLAQAPNGQVAIQATFDGGYHWSQQLALANKP